MATSGIRRKVDDLGRVVIPAGIRRSLGIREGDPVEVAVEGERVVLTRPRDACVFCGREEEDLAPFRGRLVCSDCVTSLGEMGERIATTRRADAAGGPTAGAGAAGAASPVRGPADLPEWDAPARRGSPTAGRAPGGEAPAPRPAPGPRPVPGPRPSPAPAGEPDLAADEAPAPGDAGPRRGDPPPADPVDEAPPVGRDPRRPRPPYDPSSTTAW